MEITKEQRIIFLNEALKIIDNHEPSLESYIRDVLPKYLRHHPETTVETFFERIPEKNRTPKAKTVLKDHYPELRKRFQDELDELTKKSK